MALDTSSLVTALKAQAVPALEADAQKILDTTLTWLTQQCVLNSVNGVGYQVGAILVPMLQQLLDQEAAKLLAPKS